MAKHHERFSPDVGRKRAEDTSGNYCTAPDGRSATRRGAKTAGIGIESWDEDGGGGMGMRGDEVILD